MQTTSLIEWRLLRDDGSPFPIDSYGLRAAITNGRGRLKVERFTVTGTDNNVLCIELDPGQLFMPGYHSISLDIAKCGRPVARAEYKNAFRVTSGYERHCDCQQKVRLTSYVNILHPESVGGEVTVLFPRFEIDPEDMHLHLLGTTDQYTSNFELSEDGHLLFKNQS